MEKILAGVALSVFLLLIWSVALFRARRDGRGGNYYRASLVDFKNGSVILDSFTLYAFSYEEALACAYRRLKRRQIYQADEDVKSFVTFHEIGADLIAGYDDIPPEALRRLVFNISIADGEKM